MTYLTIKCFKVVTKPIIISFKGWFLFNVCFRSFSNFPVKHGNMAGGNINNSCNLSDEETKMFLIHDNLTKLRSSPMLTKCFISSLEPVLHIIAITQPLSLPLLANFHNQNDNTACSFTLPLNCSILNQLLNHLPPCLCARGQRTALKGDLQISHPQKESRRILQTLVSSLSETVWGTRAGRDEWAWLALSAA